MPSQEAVVKSEFTAQGVPRGMSGDTSYIVVSTKGHDTLGDGSFNAPFLTLTKAFTLWTAARPTIYVLAGDYEEAATLTWPNVTGLSIIPIGEVSISNGDAAAQVLLIQPTFTASTFGATIGAINLAATGAQIGLKVANANMTKKLNLYLKGLTIEAGSSGDSVDIAGTVSGQAIRVYSSGCNFEGLFHFTANDAGSRLRDFGSEFIGGIDTTGAVAAELTLRASTVIASGLDAIDAAWLLTYRGCMYTDDGDPPTYTAITDGYSG